MTKAVRRKREYLRYGRVWATIRKSKRELADKCADKVWLSATSK